MIEIERFFFFFFRPQVQFSSTLPSQFALRMLKRSPEVVFGSLLAFVVVSPLDFSRYVDKIMPAALGELQHTTSEPRRATALNLLTVLASKSSDPATLGRLCSALTSSLVDPSKSKALGAWAVRVAFADAIAGAGAAQLSLVPGAMKSIVSATIKDLTVCSPFVKLGVANFSPTECSRRP